jgi:hypothetical protein
VSGRKLSPESLTELNGLEPTLNCRLKKSWHEKEERMYGKGQAGNTRALAWASGRAGEGLTAMLLTSDKSSRPPRNMHKVRQQQQQLPH